MNIQNIDSKFLIIGAVAVGGVVGYTLGYRRAAKKWIALADEEINNIQEQNRRLRMGFDTPTEALKTLHPEVEEPSQYLSTSEEPEEPTKTIKTGNVFNNYSGERVVEVEEPEEKEERTVYEFETLPEPDPDNPYVISADTFMEVDDAIDKTTLTYFEVDETLVDERNNVIYDVDNLIGLENLTKFGLGTSEKHVVHVRNEALYRDFEIVREEAAYVEVILGQEQKNRSKKTPKMPREDD